MNRQVSIGIIQRTCSAHPAENLQTTIQEIRKVAAQGAQIICLQELFQTLYFCDVEDHANYDLAESVPGPTTELLQSVAKELQVVIVASLFEKRASGIYHNTAAVLDADGRYLGKYRKMHIPDDPGYYEKFYFTPGDLGYQVFQTKYAKLGVLICWDQWFPEAARITSLMGAEVLVYPTAIGWDSAQDDATNQEQYDAWQTIQRGHAIANGVHVVATNRVGLEGNKEFWGGSLVANPMGKLLWQASGGATSQVVAIDLEQSDYYRTHWPFLRDRRIDSYQDINQRFLDEP